MSAAILLGLLLPMGVAKGGPVGRGTPPPNQIPQKKNIKDKTCTHALHIGLTELNILHNIVLRT